MSISKEQQEKNKMEYLSMFSYLGIPEEKVERFRNWVLKTDFFTAPASIKGSLACEGGLCQHTLKVVKLAVDLFKVVYPQSTSLGDSNGHDVVLASLLHDISKTKYYETYVSNKKVYSENGSKFDEQGRFDWVAVSAKNQKEPSDRFVYASLSQTSEFMARQFFDVNLEVSCAILHHKGPYDENTSTGSQLGTIFSAHPLASILHAADFLATHIQTGEDETA